MSYIITFAYKLSFIFLTKNSKKALGCILVKVSFFHFFYLKNTLSNGIFLSRNIIAYFFKLFWLTEVLQRKFFLMIKALIIKVFLIIKISIFLFFWQIIFTQKTLAQQEARSSREAVISSQSKKFFQSNRTRQYLSLGGSYGSDYNSKSYQINSRYFMQNENFTNEINAQHQVDYVDTGSGKNKKYKVKKSELYDLMLSSKARILKSNNYAVIYHRSIYDKFSTFFYDQRTAMGVGHMFLNQKLEIDFSLAYRDVKMKNYEINYLSSLRIIHKFNNKLSLMQRSYIFFDNNLLDQEHKTSLIYRLNNQISFEVRHNFEKRRYVDVAKKTAVNQISRGVIVGLIFDLY